MSAESGYVGRTYRAKRPATKPASQRRQIMVIGQVGGTDSQPDLLRVEGNGGWTLLSLEQINRRYTYINPSLETP